RERRLRQGIVDEGELLGVVVEALAEVAFAFGGGGHEHVAQRVGGQLALKFLTEEEECLVLGTLEDFGNVDGAADVIAEIVIAEKRLGQAPRVIDKSVGVEAVVAVIPIAAAVELVAAALGDECNLATDAAAVFRLVAAGEDFEFSDGVDADADVHTAVVAGIDIADAVDGKLILRGAGAVDGEDVGAGAGAGDGVAAAGREVHTGHELRHVESIAAVDLDVLDLVAGDGGGALHAFGLEDGGLGGDLDGVGD